MISLKYLSRYKELSWFLVKYGKSDIAKFLGLSTPKSTPSQELPTAQEFVSDLESLGPTFIKLGQFFSTQEDLLPAKYQEALSDLQDNVASFPFEEVEKILFSELGVKIKDSFNEFDPKPFAAGSLSQVHHAELISGVPVAVKVQRPGIEEKILNDLEMLKELAIFLDQHEYLGKHYYWESRIKSFKTILLDELDFEKEAHNLKVFSKNLKEFPDLVIPLPIDDYTKKRVLTMEYVSSRKITSLHPLIKMEIDGEPLIKELLRAYLKQIFIDGFVHIDPHPGNIYLSNTNQIVLLDLGMVEHLSPRFQEDLLKLIISISEGLGDEAANLVIKMGQNREDFNDEKFRDEISDLIARNKGMTWEEMSIGKLFLKITKAANEYNLELPQKFNTLGKMLLNLDKIGKILAPSINPNLFIQDNMEPLLTSKLQNFFSKANATNFTLDFLKIFKKIPEVIDSLFRTFSKKEFQIKIKLLNENQLMRGFEKIANRITLGLILAAMIVSAALLMRVQTHFQIFGYPGLAILLFLSATFGGLLLILNILSSDQKKK